MLTQPHNPECVSTNSGTPKCGIFELLGAGNLAALFQHGRQPPRAPVQVQNQAHGRVGNLEKLET